MNVNQNEAFPGTVSYPGWAFLYLEANDIQHFLHLLDQLGAYFEEQLDTVPDGSFGTTNSRLELPDGRSLFGVSINGVAVDVFNQQFESFAASRALSIGRIVESQLLLKGGGSFNLEDCKGSYFDF